MSASGHEPNWRLGTWNQRFLHDLLNYLPHQILRLFVFWNYKTNKWSSKRTYHVVYNNWKMVLIRILISWLLKKQRTNNIAMFHPKLHCTPWGAFLGGCGLCARTHLHRSEFLGEAAPLWYWTNKIHRKTSLLFVLAFDGVTISSLLTPISCECFEEKKNGWLWRPC